jgi:lipid-binding SYLF domain-containing protein
LSKDAAVAPGAWHGLLLAQLAEEPWIRVRVKEDNVRTVVLSVAILALVAVGAEAAQGQGEQKRVENAALVLRDMTNIQPDVWQRANCIVVIPSVKKAAFVFGGEYGKGVASCRTPSGWSAPAFFELEKGSWGLQIGGETIDLVLMVMNQSGIEHLLQDKFTLGAGGSLAAGPVGRNATAETDAQLHAEILSYSRSQGLFAGIDLSGGVLKPDNDANADTYSSKVTPRQILLTHTVKAPSTMRPFLVALREVSRSEGQPAGGIK